MKKVLFYKILSVVTLLIGLSCVNLVSAEEQGLSYHVGEKMVFQIKWTAIPAGELTIEMMPLEKINGEDSGHILLTVTSNSFVDMFYKIRDRIESYTDLKFTHSILYTESRQGKRPKDTSIEFDWVKQQALYSRKGEKEKSDPIPILPGTFDPLSAFLAFRMNDLNETKEIIIPATDGKTMISGKISVIRRETINVNGVKYDTFLLEPELRGIGGVFESKDSGAQIWVTADNRRIPVKIKSQMPFGSFIAELISYNDGVKAEADNSSK
jgi:hypothetical protein